MSLDKINNTNESDLKSLDYRQFSYEDFEKLLTEDAKKIIRKYFLYINYNSEEASDTIESFCYYKNKPISNALLLHELFECRFISENDPNFLSKKVDEKFLIRHLESHYKACEVACYYLYLKAKKLGYNVSLLSISNADPITSPHDKNNIFLDEILSEDEEIKKQESERFFKDVLLEEKFLISPSVFNIELGNSDHYIRELGLK